MKGYKNEKITMLLTLAAATAVLALSGAETAKNTTFIKRGYKMEKHFQMQIDAGIENMQQWKGNDACVIFPIITDLHSHIKNTDSLICMRRRCVEHLEYWTRTAEQAGADFAADLGDDGFDVPLKEQTEKEMLFEQMNFFYKKSKTPVIHCVGNHDTHFISNTEWGKWNREMNKGKLSFTTGEDSSYGYFDLPAKKCRVFFLNTSDGGVVSVSQDQVDFVSKALSGLPKDWTVIVMTHVCPLSRSMWRKHPPFTSAFRFPALSELLQNFAEKGGMIAGVFSGDSHANYFDYDGGVNYFVTQGYGGCSTETEKPQHMTVFHEYSETLKRTDTFNSEKYCLLDLVVIKLQKREIRIFRIGAGGSDWDRGAKY